MPGAVFPTFPGQAFEVTKNPTWSTRRVVSTSGRRVVSPLYVEPIWAFQVSFEVLQQGGAASAVGQATYDALVGFYNTIQQTADVFLFSDPTDNTAVLQNLGTGNGTQTTFICSHTFGTYVEPVGSVSPTGLNVYLGGALQSLSTYSLLNNNQIVFTTPPSSGSVVTASYAYYFLCEFPDDTMEMVNFSQSLWSVGALKFRSVKP